MYKDFKQSESLDTGFVGGSGLIWMFSGIILGLLVGLGMYYFTNNNSSALSMVGTVQNKIKQAQSAGIRQQNTASINSVPVSYQKSLSLDKEKIRQTKFSYYAVLPTLDVPVGATKPIDTSRQIATTVITNSQKTGKTLIAEKNKAFDATPAKVVKQKRNIERNGNFLLQVASYKKKSRANLTRGRLTKRGIDAYIQEKKVKGRLWYRVIAGPVDKNSINSWKSSAEKMGHRPMVISLR